MEPVVLLPLVEHHLEAAQADRHEEKAQPVDLPALADRRPAICASSAGGSTRIRQDRMSERMQTGTLMKNIQRQL